jgi:hydroxymethylbilane synthase
MSTTIRIGTRGSELALWQANHVAAQLRALGHTVELEVIRTTGDRMQNAASASFDGLAPNGTGIFIKEIEDALAAGRIDLAVHSLKDLPTKIDERFVVAAVPPRADARDAFVCEESWGLHTLASGARIGTTSPRRKAMLLALRPDIHFVEMRGNIDTRLRKWSAGEADALVLACAGLDRLGRNESVHQRFSVDEVTPAPGQGALALEVRARETGSDAQIFQAVRVLNDESAEFATAAERAVLHALGGGCQLPLGAYCHLGDEAWHMHAMVAAADGEGVAHTIVRAPLGITAEELGRQAAGELLQLGAGELLQAVPYEVSA